MLKNYLKVAIRSIRKHTAYSIINILGLAIGLAGSLIIFLFVYNEISYDNYHPEVDRIYRIAKTTTTENDQNQFAAVRHMIAPTIKDEFPEVELSFRINRPRPTHVSYEDNLYFEDNIKFVDKDIFSMLCITFISGDPQTALERPFTVVLTKEIAEKYFGDEDPLGKLLKIDTLSYEVTGIIEKAPINTHIRYSILGSWSSLETNEYMHMGWNSPGNFPTYIKVNENTDLVNLENKIKNLVYSHVEETLTERGQQIEYFLQPMTDIHLYSNLIWEVEPPGNIIYVYIFSAVGLLILLIGCLNFVSLSTALFSGRLTEIGMRRAIGAHRKDLYFQFIGETTLLFVIAFILSLIMIEIFLPMINAITNYQLSLKILYHPIIIAWLVGVVLAVSIIAGIYPSLYLNSFRPVDVLKKNIKHSQKRNIGRKVAVVVQFMVTIVLIIGVFAIYKQLNYMKNKSLGFDKEHKLVIELPRDALNSDNYESYKDEFKSYPGVLGTTVSSSVPGRWRYLWNTYPLGQQQENVQLVNWMQIDNDFISEYNLDIIAGSEFTSNVSSNNQVGSVILNEAAVKAFGWESPETALGKNIWRDQNIVIGVMKDYHSHGLQQDISPLGFYLIQDDYRYLSLKVLSDNLNKTLDFVEDKYKQLFPGTVYNYFFLDEEFNRQYLKEEKLANLFTVFTILGIIIACLGLFGLVLFISRVRYKEIGIRKVMGASFVNIIDLMTKELLVLVLISNIIAWPVAYFIITKWLDNFAYRIELNIGIFIFAGLTALLIAITTISYQSFKAAMSNPVEAIKYE